MSNTDNTTKHHFFVSSVAMWCTTGTSRTLTQAIRMFDKEKLTYTIWYVPLPPEADYEINYYCPQVAGAHLVELVEFKNGRKVK